MTAGTIIYRSKTDSSFGPKNCNIHSSSVISHRNETSAQIYSLIETPSSLCRAAGSPRGWFPPAPRPRSARGQFSSPFRLRRDSNQTTRSAKAEPYHANPLAASGRGVSGTHGVPLDAACPPLPQALRKGPRGCLRPPQGPGEQVCLHPRWEVGSAFGPTKGRPAGPREHQRQPDPGGGRRGCPQISPTGSGVCFIRLVGAAPRERGLGPGVWPRGPP